MNSALFPEPDSVGGRAWCRYNPRPLFRWGKAGGARFANFLRLSRGKDITQSRKGAKILHRAFATLRETITIYLKDVIGLPGRPARAVFFVAITFEPTNLDDLKRNAKE